MVHAVAILPALHDVVIQFPRGNQPDMPPAKEDVLSQILSRVPSLSRRILSVLSGFSFTE